MKCTVIDDASVFILWYGSSFDTFYVLHPKHQFLYCRVILSSLLPLNLEKNCEEQVIPVLLGLNVTNMEMLVVSLLQWYKCELSFNQTFIFSLPIPVKCILCVCVNVFVVTLCIFFQHMISVYEWLYFVRSNDDMFRMTCFWITCDLVANKRSSTSVFYVFIWHFEQLLTLE